MVATTFKHILLLEQRAGFRQLMREVLEELPCRVSLAANATEAQQTLALGDVDLLVANVAKTGGDECDVAGYAASIGISCLLISPSRTAKKSFGKGAATFIDEPVTLKRLCNGVAKTLMVREAASVAG